MVSIKFAFQEFVHMWMRLIGRKDDVAVLKLTNCKEI